MAISVVLQAPLKSLLTTIGAYISLVLLSEDVLSVLDSTIFLSSSESRDGKHTAPDEHRVSHPLSSELALEWLYCPNH